MTQRPLPFRQFIVKLHSRCNLACDYCYVYELRDTSWRGRPRVMGDETLALFATRLAAHARTHRLPEVRVVLHGGEPLLAGAERIGMLAELLDRAVHGTRVSLSMQTNGTLLTSDVLDVCARWDIAVGVSLDGDPTAHDRHRIYPDGRGSHARTAEGLALLRSPRYARLFAGLLATVDIRNDPAATYAALAAYAPPSVDFLLPHATWEHPPPGHDPAGTPYARWLAEVFDLWYEAPAPAPAVRLFDEIVALLLGSASRTEAVGLTPYDAIVVETDGTLELTDALKAAYDGAAATGLRLAGGDDVFEVAARHAGVAARQTGLAGLSADCRACGVVRVCGGGLYAHRFAPANGFDNPSVYCRDLYALILHIRGRVAADVAALAGRSRG